MTIHKEVLEVAFKTQSNNERHRTVAETRYWCEQYKLLAKTAIEALAQSEQQNCKDGSCDCCWAQPEQEPMPCNICGKQMNTGRVEDMDCGGDCCACMALMGDPDCEARLSKHKQEPVAHTAIFHCPNCEYPHRQVTHITGVAQPPWLPQRKPLTDEQKLNLVTNWFAEDWAIKKALGLLHDYDIEAAHGIKENT